MTANRAARSAGRRASRRRRGSQHALRARREGGAERALACWRREAQADAMKTAAYTAFFLGGGRYL